jgi:predicted HAD superfamily Cof-like phosphohydrolase
MTLEQQQVRDWMKKAGQIVRDYPTIPEMPLALFRISLIEEEVHELAEALAKENIVEMSDAMGDILYVLLGSAVSFGIDLEPIFQEIHRSNMTKLVQDGNGQWTLTKRHDGKVLKPATYEPPNLTPIIQAQCK